MVEADGRPPTPQSPAPRGRSRLLWMVIAEGVIVAALVIALVVVTVRRHDGAAVASSSVAADPGTAMCAAIPVANQVLPSIVTISARRGAQAGTGSGQIFK